MYEKSITRSEPGVILLLIDQSLSMDDPIPGDPLARTKAEAAADVVNRTLYDLVLRCLKGEDMPRNYFDLGVIGYGERVGPGLGGMLAGRELVPLPELALNPIRTEPRAQADGSVIEMPVWLEPRADGRWTRMAESFYQAGAILHEWTQEHPRSFPPILINISDGMANDPNPPQGHNAEYWAQQLKSIHTDDGYLLLLNVALVSDTSPSGGPILFPANAEVLRDQFSHFLFEISSPMTPSMIEFAGRHRIPVAAGAKGFVFNAGIDQLSVLLDIGTNPLQMG